MYFQDVIPRKRGSILILFDSNRSKMASRLRGNDGFHRRGAIIPESLHQSPSSRICNDTCFLPPPIHCVPTSWKR